MGRGRSRSRHVALRDERGLVLSTAATLGLAAVKVGRDWVLREGAKRVMRGVRSVSANPRPRKRAASRPSSAKYPSRTRRIRFRTSGFLGKRFRKGRKPRYGAFMKSGAVFATEVGQVVTSGTVGETGIVYFGHSFAYNDVLRVACMAMVRKLFTKAGFTLTDFDSPIWGMVAELHINPEMQVIWGDLGNTPVKATYSPAIIATFNSYVDYLYGSINANAVAFSSYKLYELRLNSSLDSMTDSTINLSAAFLSFDCVGQATLQNRTIAVATGEDPSKTLANDVSNNPIAGKVYTKAGNFYNLRYVNEGAAAPPVFTANNETGIIAYDINDVNVSDAMRAVLRRPPSASVFSGRVSVASVMLKPGEMRTSVVKFKKRIGLNRWLLTATSQFEAGSAYGSKGNVTYGQSRLFGFEKKCNTTIDEPSISLGYEYNCTYRCVLHSSPTPPVAVPTYIRTVV